MKLLTAIKKANKKAEQSHGAVRYFINRKKSGQWCWIEVNLEDITIDGQFSIEDLLSNDWILEKDVI